MENNNRNNDMSVIKADKQPQSDANSVQMQFKRQNCEDATQAKPEIEAKTSDKSVKTSENPKVLTTEEKQKATRLKKWKKRMRFQPKNITVDLERHEYYKELVPDSNESNFELPRALPVAEYVEETKKEIKAMMSAIKQHAGSKTALQILPKHLRRRSASHNIKRLPLRLRELASQQMTQQTKALDGQDKKVCRRKRRRKVGLQNEYSKRAGKQGWLETHLWHAKRFAMTQQTDLHYADWRHRVAIQPSDKSFRACYRAVAKHCLIQDISYFCCLELKGLYADLRLLFEKVVQEYDLQKIFDNDTISGKSEKQVLMYDVSCNEVIGPIWILWQPQDIETNNAGHVLWCWLHPSIFHQAQPILQHLSELHKTSLRDKSNELVRFRFTGPKSSVTLLSTLQPVKISKSLSEPFEHVSKKLTSWLIEHKDKVEKMRHSFIETMTDCHCSHFHSAHKQPSTGVCCGAVLSLVVNDPRLSLPLQKTKPTLKTTLNQDSCVQTILKDDEQMSQEFVSCTPLWDTDTVEEVSASRLPDHVTSTRKNEAKFSLGEEKTKHLDSLYTPVPILLIRRNGFTSVHSIKEPEASRTAQSGPPSDFGSGWDVVLPKKWATAFWIPFIYHKARAGGLRETEHSHLECKAPYFPRDFPDTDAGQKWWKAEMETNKKSYYSKPPSKRVNFNVVASPYPFAPDWEHLFLPLEDGKDSFQKSAFAEVKPTPKIAPSKRESVLTDNQNFATSSSAKRDSTLKRTSDDADDVIPRKKLKIKSMSNFSVLRDGRKVSALGEMLNTRKYVEAVNLLESLDAHFLICVQVTPINKGTPAPQAMLCAPSSDDFSELRREFEDLNGEGLKSCSGPVEPKHWDPFRKERKIATQEAKKRRKRKKKPDKEVPSINTHQAVTFNVSPSRPIIGFLTSGDYLFSYASGGGLGFVAVGHMISLLREQCANKWLLTDFSDCAKPPMALMRLTDSTQYRFVSLFPTC